MKLKGFCPCPVSPEGRGIPVNSEAVPAADSARRQSRAAPGPSRPSPDSETKVSREPDLELASEGHPPGDASKGAEQPTEGDACPPRRGLLKEVLGQSVPEESEPVSKLERVSFGGQP